MKFLWDVSTTLVTKFGTLALALVASVIISRVLQPEGKGTFALLRASADLTVAIAALGIGKSLVYYVASDELDRNQVMSTALTIIVVSGIIAVGIFIYLVFFAIGDRQVGNVSLLTLLIALLLVLTSLANGWAQGYLRGRQQIALINLASVSQSVLYVGIIVLLALPHYLTPTTSLLSLLLGTMLVFGIYLSSLIKDGVRFSLSFSWPIIKALFSYGLAYQAYGLIQNFHYRLDLLLVARFLDEAQVGYYSTSANLAQLTWNLPVSITFVLIPMIASLPDDSQSSERTAMIARIATILLIFAVVVIGVSAGWLVPLLYGEAYLPSVTPLRLLLPGMVTSGLFLILGGHLLARKKLVQLIAIGATGLALNVALNLWAIPTYGIAGASVVSSITYSLVCLIGGVYLTRSSGMKFLDLFLINRADVTQFGELITKSILLIKGTHQYRSING